MAPALINGRFVDTRRDERLALWCKLLLALNLVILIVAVAGRYVVRAYEARREPAASTYEPQTPDLRDWSPTHRPAPR